MMEKFGIAGEVCCMSHAYKTQSDAQNLGGRNKQLFWKRNEFAVCFFQKKQKFWEETFSPSWNSTILLSFGTCNKGRTTTTTTTTTTIVPLADWAHEWMSNN